MNDQDLKLEYRLVIGFKELTLKPFYFFTGKFIGQVETGMKALVRDRFDNGHLMLRYGKASLFTVQFYRHNIKGKFNTVQHKITIWETSMGIHLGAWEETADMMSDEPFNKEKLDQIEKVLKMYCYEHKIHCHLCKQPTLITEINFFPFAGGACNACKEAGKIPNVKTN